MSGPPLLSARDIGKRYGLVQALDGISLDLGPGEFLTLLGPSGSGKTTFLNVLAGFTAPDSGRLAERGVDVTARPAEARGYGMVFQGYALFPHMTVEENIGFPLRVRGLDRAARQRAVAEMIGMTGLDAHRARRPGQLSGGQQQRVALARALVFRPPVLLLDEPLSALDKGLRGQMQAELKRLHRETGSAFVLVTHDQDEALAMSDRIAIFDQGRLQQIGTPEEVYRRPASRFVAGFLGRINLFSVAGLIAAGDLWTGRHGGAVLSAPRGGPAPQAPLIGVRPEDIRLSRDDPGPGPNRIAAELTGASYGGARFALTLRTAEGLVLDCDLPGDADPGLMHPGGRLWLHWPVEKSLIIDSDPPQPPKGPSP